LPGLFFWNSSLLEVRNLSKFFGGIHAVDDASLTIEQGSITGLIGPNGAGKTTLFNVISGLYRPDAGQVYFDGQNITGKAPHELFGDGILRTFQIAHEFSTLSVRENLMVVPSGQSGERLVDTWFRPSNVAHQELQNQERANEVIDFLQLTGVANELAGNLSGGQKNCLSLVGP
jgi:branched-chain amino acid transport system ATP-binding protein